jgi:high-affinity iron transporter
MLSTAIIVFRETLEIAMILGIVLLATRGLPNRTPWVLGGLAAGLAGAGLIAVFAQSISASLEGMGQEIFNAVILFSAALVIGWTVVWMHKHAREMSAQLKQVGHKVATGDLPHYSLSLIVGLAMLREGAEIVLFTYGMLLSGQAVISVALGTLAGLCLGSFVGVLLYYGLLKVPARHALKVTSWLLILLVAGLSAQGANFLTSAGYFSDYSFEVWDSSWLLSQSSLMGQALHSLIGYSEQPTAIQLIFYIVTLAGLLSIITLSSRKTTALQQAVAQ